AVANQSANPPEKGLYRGTFDNQTGQLIWTHLTNGLSGMSAATSIRLAAAEDPFGGEIYAAGCTPVGNGSTDTAVSALFHSSNSGASWSSLTLPGDTDGGINPGGQGDEDLSIAVDPNDSTVIYMGGDSQPLPNFPNPNAAGLTDTVGRLFRGDVQSNGTVN